MAVEPRRVLFVCTANICRSPTAELLARSRFGEDSIMFRSAGLLEGGRTMPDELKSLLGDRSISTTEHRSYQMEATTLGAAELILAMEGRHVQEIAINHPEAFARTVPLVQAASMMAQGSSLDALILSLQSRDSSAYLSTDWDVEDPYKRSKRHYRKMIESVEELLNAVIGPMYQAELAANR